MSWGDLDTGSLTAGAILGIAIISIIRGWLVPRKVLEDVQKASSAAIELQEKRLIDRDEENARLVAEKDDWKTAERLGAQTNAILVRQVEELLEAGKLAQAIANSLPSSGARNG